MQKKYTVHQRHLTTIIVYLSSVLSYIQQTHLRGALLAALNRPWEVEYRDLKEAVVLVEQPGHGTVPGGKRGQETWSTCQCTLINCWQLDGHPPNTPPIFCKESIPV